MPSPEQHSHYYVDLAKLGAYAAYVEVTDGKEAAVALYGQIGRMALQNDIPEDYWRWPGRAPYEDFEAANHAELLQAYDEKFAAPIAELRERLAGPEPPEPLAKTHRVTVHVIEVENEKYAVRLVNPRLEEIGMESMFSPQFETHGYARDIAPARHKSPRLEQMVGFSMHDTVTVAEYIESVPFTAAAINVVPARHIDELFDTAETMHSNNLMPDGFKKSNLPYSLATGFNVIDFSHNKSPEHVEYIITEIATGIVAPCDEDLEDLPISPEEYRARVAFLDRVLERSRIRYADQPTVIAYIEQSITDSKRNELQPALARWYAAGQPDNRDGSTRKGTGVTVGEIRQAIQVASDIATRIGEGLAADEITLRETVQTIQSVLEDSDTPLAQEIISEVSLAWDHLQQALLLLQEGRQGLDIAVHDYRGHPL